MYKDTHLKRKRERSWDKEDAIRFEVDWLAEQRTKREYFEEGKKCITKHHKVSKSTASKYIDKLLFNNVNN